MGLSSWSFTSHLVLQDLLGPLVLAEEADWISLPVEVGQSAEKKHKIWVGVKEPDSGTQKEMDFPERCWCSKKAAEAFCTHVPLWEESKRQWV